MLCKSIPEKGEIFDSLKTGNLKNRDVSLAEYYNAIKISASPFVGSDAFSP